jgi:hypothetical protein
MKLILPEDTESSSQPPIVQAVILHILLCLPLYSAPAVRVSTSKKLELHVSRRNPRQSTRHWTRLLRTCHWTRLLHASSSAEEEEDDRHDINYTVDNNRVLAAEAERQQMGRFPVQAIEPPLNLHCCCASRISTTLPSQIYPLTHADRFISFSFPQALSLVSSVADATMPQSCRSIFASPDLRPARGPLGLTTGLETPPLPPDGNPSPQVHAPGRRIENSTKDKPPFPFFLPCLGCRCFARPFLLSSTRLHLHLMQQAHDERQPRNQWSVAPSWQPSQAPVQF